MGRKTWEPSNLPIDFFSPRWISRYIIQSITQTGDMSKAYELFLQESSMPKIKVLKNNKIRGRPKNGKHNLDY